MSRRYLEKERFDCLAWLSEEVAKDQAGVATMEVDPEWLAGAGNVEAGVASTSSYSTVDSAGDTIVSYSRHRELHLQKVGQALRM